MTQPAHPEPHSTQPVARHGAASETSATAWLRVSPKYAWVDLVGNLIPVVIAGAAAYVIPTFIRQDVPVLVVIALAVIAAAFLVNAILAFRRVRAMGYALREDDLVFRRGIMFERVVAVPYGRLQLVDVTRGPLLRALGLANLKFVTAAAATGIALPGLVDADAEALRDELIRLAESRRSGL
ncbi:PH domain-containing protein [Leucobacter sp. HNU]|uniref:PH domain-containing protein n=1 Tax=Leucobacter sp. HNU TaxID=3236805 RepID=UPI003A808344